MVKLNVLDILSLDLRQTWTCAKLVAYWLKEEVKANRHFATSGPGSGARGGVVAQTVVGKSTPVKRLPQPDARNLRFAQLLVDVWYPEATELLTFRLHHCGGEAWPRMSCSERQPRDSLQCSLARSE